MTTDRQLELFEEDRAPEMDPALRSDWPEIEKEYGPLYGQEAPE